MENGEFMGYISEMIYYLVSRDSEKGREKKNSLIRKEDRLRKLTNYPALKRMFHRVLTRFEVDNENGLAATGLGRILLTPHRKEFGFVHRWEMMFLYLSEPVESSITPDFTHTHIYAHKPIRYLLLALVQVIKTERKVTLSLIHTKRN